MDSDRMERDIDMDKAKIYEDLVAVWAARDTSKQDRSVPTGETAEASSERDGGNRTRSPSQD